MLVVDTFNPPSAWFNVIDDSDANGTAVCPSYSSRQMLSQTLVNTVVSLCHYTIQSDIVEYSTEFVDGRMRCM